VARPKREPSTVDPTPWDGIHRDAPKVGRRPKVRAGTTRSVFRGAKGERATILHYSTLSTEKGPVHLDGSPVGEPRDWVDVAVNVIAGAKLSVLAYLDGIREVPEEQRRGIPDPRGPKLGPGQTLGVSEAGVSVRHGFTSYYAGRGEAVPAVMLLRVRASGFAPPEWISEPLVGWLLQLASGGSSGGAGQLSKVRLAELLRDPPALGAELMRRAGTNRTLKSIAARLPRKRRTRP
jgi:hypothetical protein